MRTETRWLLLQCCIIWFAAQNIPGALSCVSKITTRRQTLTSGNVPTGLPTNWDSCRTCPSLYMIQLTYAHVFPPNIMYFSFIVNVSELKSTKSRPSPGTIPAAQGQSCYFLSGSLQSVGVTLTALWPRANKALYLEEIATSSCDLHKIEGSWMLTTLAIETQASSDKGSFSPFLSGWSLYLKGTLRLSPVVLGTMRKKMRN